MGPRLINVLPESIRLKSDPKKFKTELSKMLMDLIPYTSFQKKLYDTFMNTVVRTVAVPNPLKAFAVCCKVCTYKHVVVYLYFGFLAINYLGIIVWLFIERAYGDILLLPFEQSRVINTKMPIIHTHQM